MLKVKIKNFNYNETTALKNIDFIVKKGSNLALIGESGCGKSTLLKIIYGLYDCDNGVLFWNDNQILGPKYHLVPGMSYMKYLAQDFDLMPYITVGENVGKFLSNFFPEQKQLRIDELLALVEMLDFKNVKAKNLSGGQMQRVALAKALAQEPEVLLLDEPFSHIDNFRKNKLRRKIFSYLKEKNIAVIVASHDVNDILSFSDEIIVLKNGSVIEEGNTTDIYTNPQNFYTASLFNDVNEIDGEYLNLEKEKMLVYPYQLKVVPNSKLKVNVVNSYFKGSCFLNEALYEKGTIFFETREKVLLNTVFLELSKK